MRKIFFYVVAMLQHIFEISIDLLRRDFNLARDVGLVNQSPAACNGDQPVLLL